MPCCVCAGAFLTCSFGAAPSVLNVLPAARVMSSQALASIMDSISMVNIMPFGMCSSLANPNVASATAAALGVLTPMPCIPVIAGQPEAVDWRQTCPYRCFQAHMQLGRHHTDIISGNREYTMLSRCILIPEVI